jgi:hypothetical protein
MSEGPEQQLPPAGWQYRPDNATPPAPVTTAAPASAPAVVSPPVVTPVVPAQDSPGPEDLPPGITWTASEYVAHHKSPLWYAAFIIGVSIVCALVYLVTHDRVSTIALIIIAILFVLVAARKPRIITYSIDSEGITIGERFHRFEEFRSFTVHEEDAFVNIELLPLKRLMPLMSVYCPPENEDDVLDMMATHLPYSKPSNSLGDNIARRIRF